MYNISLNMSGSKTLENIPYIKQELDDPGGTESIEFEEGTLNMDNIKLEPCGDASEGAEDDLDILNNQKFPFLASILRPKVIPAKHHEARLEECNICGKTVKYLEKHLETHEGIQPQECTVCGKLVKHLDKHMEVHEDSISAVRCNVCGKKVKYLERHMEMHENKRFACTYCRRVFTRKCYIQNHIRDKHKGMPFEIMEVDETFVQQRLREELNDPLRIARCTCAYCGTICKTSKGLTNHLWMKHKKYTVLSETKHGIKSEKPLKEEIVEDPEILSNFKCSFCGILCKISQSLTNHLLSKHNKTPEENIIHAEQLANASKNSEPDEVHECPECGIVCKTAKTLSNHQQYKHRNEQFICDHCGKIFACKPYLKLHIRLMHQPVVLIKCSLCDELFKRKSSLSRHMKTHLPKSQRKDKQFPCEHCPESFNTRRDLLEHIKVTHKALNCFMCEEVFFNKVEFGKHVITHSDYKKQVELRPFACDICGKRFQIESYCKSHKALQHTNDGNANKCADCGKEFLNAILLKKHRRNHARKYKCHICNVTCLRRAKLDKHLAIHMVDTPFKCKFCNSSFQARVALHSHLRWHASQKNAAHITATSKNNDNSEADDSGQLPVSSPKSNQHDIQHEIFSDLTNSLLSQPSENTEVPSHDTDSKDGLTVPPSAFDDTGSVDQKLTDLLTPKVLLSQDTDGQIDFRHFEDIKVEIDELESSSPFSYMISPHDIASNMEQAVFSNHLNLKPVSHIEEDADMHTNLGAAEYTSL